MPQKAVFLNKAFICPSFLIFRFKLSSICAFSLQWLPSTDDALCVPLTRSSNHSVPEHDHLRFWFGVEWYRARVEG
jgi:hypothetical protein